MKSILLEMSTINREMLEKSKWVQDAALLQLLTEIKLRDRWISEIHTLTGVNNEHRQVLN